jgi:glycosyltransferase involved in cell wall biosynthesis
MLEKQAPLFSIIIPTFNAEKVLATAIESIQAQSLKDYEIIIVDGNSTDLTIEIILSYAHSLGVIHYVSENDKGIYDAMNKGIQMATGTFLYFLGADDYLIDSLVLTDIKEIITDAKYDVIYGNVRSPALGPDYNGRFSDADIFYKNIAHQAIFYKRDLFNQVGFYDTSYRVHADWAHNIIWFFDTAITNLHINRTIAHFSDGGFSSIKKDPTFRKNILLLYYANARKRHTALKTLRLMVRGIFTRLTR